MIDNGSSDNTREIAKKYGARVLRDDSMNVSGLRNLGAKQASGNVLAFVDADCIVSEDWLTHAAQYVEEKDIVAWGAPPVLPDSANWLQRTWYSISQGIPPAFPETQHNLCKINGLSRITICNPGGGAV